MKGIAFLRRLTKHLFLACLLLALLLSAFLWYITTQSFQEMIRGRLVSAIERATGGRAELGSFHVVPLRFQVEVRDLTIHGREAPSEVPLVHVDAMSAIVDLSSVLGAKIGFHSLTLRHPVVHLIFYPDGSTNEPVPQRSASDFKQLFAFRIDRLQVEQGEVLWQDQPIPVEFTSNDISATLDYSFLHLRYSGALSVGKAEMRLPAARPFAWSGSSNFMISSNAVEIRSAVLNSERSRLQFAGAITDFRHPTLKGNYELILDLPQAGAVVRESSFTSGTLQVKGTGSWSAQTFSSDGLFDAAGVSLGNRTVTLKNASAGGKFSFGPSKISIHEVQGRMLGGEFTADGVVSDWQAPAAASRRSKQQPRGELKIKVKDLSLAETLSALGAQFRPENQLKFAGDLSGSSDVRWTGAVRNSEISVALDVSRPSRTGKGDIPVMAAARGTYALRSGLLQLDSFSMNTAASQMRASGTLASTAPMRVSSTTTDLREWQAIIAALFPKGAPFLVNGRASFNGTVSADSANWLIAGSVQAQDFETMLQFRTAPATRQHWDSLAADVQISPGEFSTRNAVLHSGNETIKLDGSIGLLGWEITPESPVRMVASAINADAAQLLRLVGAHLPVDGLLNGDGEFSGTVSKPQGHGIVTLTNGVLDGHPFDLASASIQFTPATAVFKDAHLARGRARVSGSGTYDFVQRAVVVDIAGNGVDLAEFLPTGKSGLRVGGNFDFSAHAAGSMAAPDVTAHLRVHKVTLNEETAGDYLIDAVTHGQDLRVTGRSDFPNAELLIDGNVQLREFWPAHINLHFNRLDVDSFIESYLHGHVTGHSAVAGDLVVEGPLRKPNELTLTGNLTDFYADVEKVKLRNDGPLRFTLTNQRLSIANFHLVGENTDFSGGGFMQFAGERRLNFTGRGTLGLQLLQTYDPDLTGSGTISGDAHVVGTWEKPVIQGQVQIAGAAVSDVNLPSALTEMNGTLSFSQSRVSVQQLSARVGGGTVNFEGHAELANGQIVFDVSASAQSVRMRYPPGVSSTADATVRWSGSSTGSLLSGDITITKIGVTPGFDFGAYLEKTVESASLPQTDPVLNKIRLDLHVVTAPQLQMQTSVLRLRGEADLRVRGNAAKPVLLGRADVFEGEAYFGGTKYRLERGGVTFANPAVTTPFLDLEATTRVRDYDITLSMTGPADKPKLNYRSEPPLPTSDIITLLAFGQTSETSAQLQQTNQSVFSSQASSAMLTAALNATLNNRTQRLFGNSSIKIDPQGLETETSPAQTGPAVTIEQQVRDNLTLAYTTDVAQTSQQVIRAEYNVSRNVSIVAIRDQYGVVSFDVRIRRRKR